MTPLRPITNRAWARVPGRVLLISVYRPSIASKRIRTRAFVESKGEQGNVSRSDLLNLNFLYQRIRSCSDLSAASILTAGEEK